MDIGLKSFISEDQIEQRKKIRQERWEQQRTEDQPLECPEEEYDPRTLYERLKEQKDKKQEEYEESKKLKHYIKVLDNEEVEFLEKVDEQKERELQEKLDEERLAIGEFKKRVSNLTEQQRKTTDLKKSIFTRQPATNESAGQSSQLARTTTRRQAKLLQNAVKRKASDDGEEGSSKRVKDDDEDNKHDKNEKSSNDDGDKNDQNADDSSNSVLVEQPELKPAFKVLGVLSGIGPYISDSSGSDRSESDSEEDTQINSTELNPLYMSGKTREIVRLKKTLKKMNQ